MRRWMAALTLLLVSCGGPSASNSSTPSASASAVSATPTTSPTAVSNAAITQVAAKVFPPSSPQSHPPGTEGYVECEFSTGVDFDFSNCPVTVRFLARLHLNPSASDMARPFCRCQNILPKRDITVEATDSGVLAHVDLGNAQIDLVMTVDGGRLLVDDTQCPGGGPATSYYVEPVPPC
jgi:hypothetical protein